MRRVVQLIADYGPGELAFAEQLQRLCAGRTHGGAVVVGPDAGWSWSFVVDELRQLFYLDVGSRGVRRPVRDLIALGVRHAAARHPHAVAELVPRDSVPRVPACAIAWIDRAGNLTTTLSRPPAEAGGRVRVEIGEAGAVALVVADREAVPEGELALAPCSIGWPKRDGSRRRLLELGIPGGNASELFDRPPTGAPVAFAPVEPRAAA